MTKLRSDLPPLPDRIAKLPIDERGYPVPWFAPWVNGKPEFRMGDASQFIRAIRQSLCWVCGEQLGRYRTFVLGPMCTVNRISAEPPCHKDCAEFSAMACPFLTKPHMVRRENDLPDTGESAGIMLRRNPGVVALWTTRSHKLIPDGKGKVLFQVGDPEAVAWFAEGRTATREEVTASIDGGLPSLMELAKIEGTDAVAELNRMLGAAMKYLPLEATVVGGVGLEVLAECVETGRVAP